MIEGPSNESRAWNAEEIERLGDLIFNGKDISQIAQILGRPYGAVKCKANTLGMLPNRARVTGTLSLYGQR